MIQILLILICAASLSLLLNKKIHELLPLVLMAAILAVYGLGIIFSYVRFKGGLKAASVAVMLMLALVTLVCLVIAFRQNHTSKGIIKAIVMEKIVIPQIIITLITCAVFAFIFSTHRIMHWDDLSYWGIYTKNLLCIDRIPFGVENCSISYKDYNPIMQIMEYFFMFTAGTIKEEQMFQVNVCFMYVLMMPFLNGLRFRNAGTTGKRLYILRNICIIVMYIIFPHLFSTQFYYKLGVDYLMGLLFGYGIYLICAETDAYIYQLIALIVASSFLTMMKTSGVILSIFLAVFWTMSRLFRNSVANVGIKTASIFKTATIIVANAAITVMIPMCFWLSWKLWGRRTGNAGYLSDKVTENVRTMAHLFPDYTQEVVLNYIKHVFTYPLTRERVGLTAFVMIVMIVVIHVCRGRDQKLFAAMMAGLFVFCLGHLYMYLFVFDDWEAFGLLEYDRYIGQYLAGVFYYYMMNLWDDGQKVLDRWKASKTKVNPEAGLGLYLNPAIVITVLMIAMLPYPSIKTFLLQTEYNKLYNDSYIPMRQTAIDEWNECELREMNLPMDEDHRVMLMANAWTDELQYYTYEMAPCAVTVVENLPALEEGTVSSFCRDLIRARGIEYVYPMKNSQEAYGGDFAQETRELTQSGESIEPGRVYEVIRDGDDIWLR